MISPKRPSRVKLESTQSPDKAPKETVWLYGRIDHRIGKISENVRARKLAERRQFKEFDGKVPIPHLLNTPAAGAVKSSQNFNEFDGTCASLRTWVNRTAATCHQNGGKKIWHIKVPPEQRKG